MRVESMTVALIAPCLSLPACGSGRRGGGGGAGAGGGQAGGEGEEWTPPSYDDLDGYEEEELSCDEIDNDCDGVVDGGGVCGGAGLRSATLCDENWADANGVEHGGSCGVEGDPTLSYWLDLDAGRKVPPRDERADISKGHTEDCCSWAVQNGALYFRTEVPSAGMLDGAFPCDDDMPFNDNDIGHGEPFINIVCVRTPSGALFAYRTEFECCGDNNVQWRAERD